MAPNGKSNGVNDGNGEGAAGGVVTRGWTRDEMAAMAAAKANALRRLPCLRMQAGDLDGGKSLHP